MVPTTKNAFFRRKIFLLKIDEKKVREQQSLLFAKDEEIEKLRAQIEALSAKYTAAKEQHEQFVRPHKLEQEDITEAQIRKQYIDVDLQLMGWELTGDRQNVSVEYEVNDMGNVYGRQGFIDYVLWGKDGLPLAVIEAKRASKDPKIGRQQAVLYADALERKFGRRPLIFFNGFEAFFWDDKAYPLRSVSGIFSEDDLEKIIQRRTSCKELASINISDAIMGRVYQKEAIRAACVKNINTLIDADGSMRTAVKLKARYVNKFKEQAAFASLNVQDKGEILEQIAPLVSLYDTDIAAKRFDNLMYSLILAVVLEDNTVLAYGRNQLNKTVRALEKKQTITEVKNKLPLIKRLMEPEFAKKADLLTWEEVRKELRELIKFLDDSSQTIIYTNLEDEVLEVKAGETMKPAYDFEDYKQKVNRYVLGNSNNIVIYKLMHNKKLSSKDYKELERLFTQELGTLKDYEQAYGATPFGLLIRKIAKLDHNAAMEAFSQFINDAALNDRQIAFVHKVIGYVEANGYIDDVKNLMQPSFDKPVKLLKLFSAPKVKEIMDIVQSIKDNAIA